MYFLFGLYQVSNCLSPVPSMTHWRQSSCCLVPCVCKLFTLLSEIRLESSFISEIDWSLFSEIDWSLASFRWFHGAKITSFIILALALPHSLPFFVSLSLSFCRWYCYCWEVLPMLCIAPSSNQEVPASCRTAFRCAALPPGHQTLNSQYSV